MNARARRLDLNHTGQCRSRHALATARRFATQCRARFPGTAAMPRACVTAARLAQVVRDPSGTRHARRRTYGGDPPLELVTIEAVEPRKIGHASARAEICSGIVGRLGVLLALTILSAERPAAGSSRTGRPGRSLTTRATAMKRNSLCCSRSAGQTEMSKGPYRRFRR
jgi:hypothetical protein